MCQSIFMELGRTEAKFFGIVNLPLIEIPHHPSGGARAGEHRADAEGAIGSGGEDVDADTPGAERVDASGMNLGDTKRGRS